MHHRRTQGDGRLAEAMQNSNCRDAIHRSLLGRGIRHSATSGFGGVPGECPGHEESARAEERRTGESMADEAAHLWTVAKFVPAITRDSCDADLLEAAQRSRAECGSAYSADAEGADANESAVGQCVDRYQRSNRTGHHQGHSRRRTQSAYAR